MVGRFNVTTLKQQYWKVDLRKLISDLSLHRFPPRGVQCLSVWQSAWIYSWTFRIITITISSNVRPIHRTNWWWWSSPRSHIHHTFITSNSSHHNSSQILNWSTDHPGTKQILLACKYAKCACTVVDQRLFFKD